MTIADTVQAATPSLREDLQDMTKFGVTRVPVDYFHYKEFRYTNLDDAIAQAKRERQSDGTTSAPQSGVR